MMIFLRGLGEFLTRGGDVSGIPGFVAPTSALVPAGQARHLAGLLANGWPGRSRLTPFVRRYRMVCERQVRSSRTASRQALGSHPSPPDRWRPRVKLARASGWRSLVDEALACRVEK